MRSSSISPMRQPDPAPAFAWNLAWNRPVSCFGRFRPRWTPTKPNVTWRWRLFPLGRGPERQSPLPTDCPPKLPLQARLGLLTAEGRVPFAGVTGLVPFLASERCYIDATYGTRKQKPARLHLTATTC